MNYLLVFVNIILTFVILYNIYNWTIMREGLDGCEATPIEQENRRKRGATRREIDNTIKDLKAEINNVLLQQNALVSKIKSNENKLRKITEKAEEKARKFENQRNN